MEYTDKQEIAKDICMSYGYDLFGFVSYRKMNREDEKFVKDYLEEWHETGMC